MNKARASQGSLVKKVRSPHHIDNRRCHRCNGKDMSGAFLMSEDQIHRKADSRKQTKHGKEILETRDLCSVHFTPFSGFHDPCSLRTITISPMW